LVRLLPANVLALFQPIIIGLVLWNRERGENGKLHENSIFFIEFSFNIATLPHNYVMILVAIALTFVCRGNEFSV